MHFWNRKKDYSAAKPVNQRDEDCPFWHQAVRKVCHRCPLYVQLRGIDPNTGQEIDDWNCAFPYLLPIMLENTHMSRQAGAATESLRNEQVKVAENMMKAAAIAAQQMKKLE